MSEPDPTKIFRAPGRLIANPSGYSPSGSHGGTVLGAVTGVLLDVATRYEAIYHDELGKAGEVVAIQESPLVRAVLRARDNDAMQRVFTHHAGSVTTLGADPLFMSPTNSLVLLYAPDDPEAPGFILLNAIPLIETAEMGLAFSILRETQLAVTFMGLNTSAASPVTGRIGKVSDILV